MQHRFCIIHNQWITAAVTKYKVAQKRQIFHIPIVVAFVLNIYQFSVCVSVPGKVFVPTNAAS